MEENDTVELVLLPAEDIRKQQDKIARTGQKFMEMVRENANQCLAHFKAHGDITLMERLISVMPRGVVVAGLAKWAQDHAPVKFDRKGKAEVTGKPEETKLDEAMAKDWASDAAVKERATKPIEMPTIPMIKGRILGLKKLPQRYNENAPDDKKMSQAQIDLIDAFIDTIIAAAEKVSVIRPKETEAPVTNNQPVEEAA